MTHPDILQVIAEVCALGVLVKFDTTFVWMDDDGATPDGLTWLEVGK